MLYLYSILCIFLIIICILECSKIKGVIVYLVVMERWFLFVKLNRIKYCFLIKNCSLLEFF